LTRIQGLLLYVCLALLRLLRLLLLQGGPLRLLLLLG
jgi:hypothetical protein